MIAERIEPRIDPAAAYPTMELPPLPSARRERRHRPASARGDRPRSAADQPMGHRGSRVVRHVRTLHWRSPMTLAVLVASFCVTLAAVYISAYARVAAEGLQEVQLKRAIHLAEEQREGLQAQVSYLSLASDVQKTASDLSMVPNDIRSESLVPVRGANYLRGAIPAPAATARHAAHLTALNAAVSPPMQ